MPRDNKAICLPENRAKKGRGRCIEGCVGHFSDPLFMKNPILHNKMTF